MSKNSKNENIDKIFKKSNSAASNSVASNTKQSVKTNSTKTANAPKNSKDSAWKKIAAITMILLVVLGVIVSVALHNNHPKGDDKTVGPAITTSSLSHDGAYFSVGDAKPKQDAPVVDVWQDFQCPTCKAVDDAIGDNMQQLALNGDIVLRNHTMTFLDTKLKNDSSSRAAYAAACADEVHAYPQYYAVIYKNQPTAEGAGYTDDQLLNGFANQAGITGKNLVVFQKCYNDGSTHETVKNMASKALQDGITGTPTYKVNGKEINFYDLMNAGTSDELLNILKKS